MKKHRSNGRGNGEARTNALLERLVGEISLMRKEFKGEIGELRREFKHEIREVRMEIAATNERIDRLVSILAPRIKNHEDRITRLERTTSA